jgi:predicted translin family RNA/ssDNA-binding protein
MERENVITDFHTTRDVINGSFTKIEKALRDDHDTIDVEFAEIEAQVAELRDLLGDLHDLCNEAQAEERRSELRAMELQLRLSEDPRLPSALYCPACDD